jgi:hypothetical protein
MLSGWTNDEERRHVVRLVAGGDALSAARGALAEVTGEHVYSVQKGGGGSSAADADHLNALCAEVNPNSRRLQPKLRTLNPKSSTPNPKP